MPQYVSVFNRNKWKTLKQVSKLSREELLEGGIKSQHLFKIVDAIANISISAPSLESVIFDFT